MRGAGYGPSALVASLQREVQGTTSGETPSNCWMERFSARSPCPPLAGAGTPTPCPGLSLLTLWCFVVTVISIRGSEPHGNFTLGERVQESFPLWLSLIFIFKFNQFIYF